MISESKLRLYKTAYSPLYDTFVGIKKVPQGRSGRVYPRLHSRWLPQGPYPPFQGPRTRELLPLKGA